MHLTPDNRLKKPVVIGDRVLMQVAKPDKRTASGFYLPAFLMLEKEEEL